MTDEAKLEGEELHEIQRGLRMAQPPEPEALAREKKWLAELETEPWLKRCRGYLRLSGPGYLQSAMTLGGGTAVTSLFAGAAFGYKLLWVAPVAMIMGIVMLSAISWQTLSTGMRALRGDEAIRRRAARLGMGHRFVDRVDRLALSAVLARFGGHRRHGVGGRAG